MNVTREKIISLKQTLFSETRKYLVLTAYISLVMFGLKIYKKMILDEFHISYFHVGFSLFEAMVLAKIIMLGEFLRIGERFNHKPLIIKTVYKAFCMSLLAMVFSFIEFSVEGIISSRGFSDIMTEIIVKGHREILAHTLIMFINFIPLFAIWETGKSAGQNELWDLLFVSGRSDSPER